MVWRTGTREAGRGTGPCPAFGGGIYNRGTLMMINNSTLTDNSAGTACSTSIHCRVGVGGAFYTFGGTVTLNNAPSSEWPVFAASEPVITSIWPLLPYLRASIFPVAIFPPLRLADRR